jgi:hypothetical protein
MVLGFTASSTRESTHVANCNYLTRIALGCTTRGPCGQTSQPNVLVIMTDEHNASVLYCYGNKIIRTPNPGGD